MKAASRDFLLLQKAECFMLRKIMKARDAFDIYRLRQSGVVLNQNLENHLEDTLMGDEIDATDIAARELPRLTRSVVVSCEHCCPQTVFESLAKGQFSLSVTRFAICTDAGCSRKKGGRRIWIG